MSMTDNQPSVIDEGEFTVRRTIHISAPIEKVWSAVTLPEHISRWFGQTVLDGSGPGARGTITWPERDSVPLQVEAIDAPTMVAYRWNNDDASGTVPGQIDLERSTVFTFTLEATAGGTQLTVVESGFDRTSDPSANLESHRQGWNAELDKLVSLLEGGA
jgi:uncharacterized protein YndB with AHSA1/START domain